jgi:hypothetical protein
MEASWLWPNVIPLGQLTLVTGKHKVGKSMFALWLASRVSSGRPWPGSSVKSETGGGVLILQPDDKHLEASRRVLQGMGADLSLIQFGTIDGALIQENIKLIIVDPYTGGWEIIKDKNVVVVGTALSADGIRARTIWNITEDREDRKARVIQAAGKTVLRFRVQYDQLALVTEFDASPILRDQLPPLTKENPTLTI